MSIHNACIQAHLYVIFSIMQLLESTLVLDSGDIKKIPEGVLYSRVGMDVQI